MADSFESRFDLEYGGEIPPDVDQGALERMDALAHALDESIRIPGTKVSVGIDPILGVLPVAGDLVSAGISLYIIVEAANLGVSYTTLLRMIANVGIDVGSGSIPAIGTLFDTFWRANKRNVGHVLADLAERRPEHSADSGHAETGVDIPIRSG